MYAHEVIEDIKKIDTIVSSGKIWKLKGSPLVDDLCLCISSAQKFHTPPKKELEKMMLRDIGEKRGEQIFLDEDLLLPFPQCWFDYFDETEKFKRGFLLMQAKDDELKKVGITSISFMKGTDIKNVDRRGWWPFGNFFKFTKDKNKLVMYHEYDLLTNEIVSFNPDAPEDSGREFTYILSVLLFLSCKNIGTESKHPDKKLNQKRVKNGKLPLFTYKTLVIKPTGKKQESTPMHLWDNRVHLCRGHFKEYTEDNKLFGRHTGRYWWQPCVRGNKEKGVVIKDYVINGLGKEQRKQENTQGQDITDSQEAAV